MPLSSEDTGSLFLIRSPQMNHGVNYIQGVARVLQIRVPYISFHGVFEHNKYIQYITNIYKLSPFESPYRFRFACF